MNEIELLKERVLKLEQSLLGIKRARSGLMVQPTLNRLGQNTEIDGDLSLTGSITLNNYLCGKWTSYTPVWATDSTPQPAIGNGTLSGKYAVVDNIVVAKIKFTAGTTTTFGTGGWRFTAPIAPTGTYPGDAGAVLILDTGTAWYSTTMAVMNTTQFYLPLVNSGAPMTWASGDMLLATIIYEIQ